MNSMNIQGTSALNPKKEIIKINALKSEMAKLRVAGYARVSSDSADQLNSFSTQVNYYQRIINTNPMWQMTEVYADEGISGVSVNKRDDFTRMLSLLLGLLYQLFTKRKGMPFASFILPGYLIILIGS